MFECLALQHSAFECFLSGHCTVECPIRTPPLPRHHRPPSGVAIAPTTAVGVAPNRHSQ